MAAVAVAVVVAAAVVDVVVVDEKVEAMVFGMT